MNDFLHIITPSVSLPTSVRKGNKRSSAPPSKSQANRSRRIKAALASHGLTQHDLARDFGCHHNTIWAAIKYGANKPTLARIERRLGITNEAAA